MLTQGFGSYSGDAPAAGCAALMFVLLRVAGAVT